MVKLIRLLGDSDKSNSEIRNTFRQPIMIGANAKVALVGASALLTDDLVNENFVIDDFNKYFYWTTDASGLVSYLTNGSYSAHELVNEFAIGANYAGTAAGGVGVHHTTSLVDNHFVLTSHRALIADPDFNVTNDWEVTAGSTTVLTATAITAGVSGATIINSPFSQAAIPMAHNVFSGTLLDCSGSKNIQIYGAVLGDVKKWGLEVTSGVYYAIVNGSSVSLTTNWAVNDTFRMDAYAGSLHITIKDSTGTLKKQYDVLDAIPRSSYGSIAGVAHYRWNLVLSASTAITTAQCTILYNVPELGTVHDIETAVTLTFVNPSGRANILLSTFLGFGLNGGRPIKYSGNPARLQARGEMLGIAAYPGILVAIDGLGPLESYDGAANSSAQDNILHVINDLSVVSNNQLQLDIPAPFYLNMKNPKPITITELRARFLPATGQKSNPVLEFTGKPSLAILIDDSN